MNYIKFYISEIDTNLLKTVSGKPGKLIKLIQSGIYNDDAALKEQLYTEQSGTEGYRKLKYKTRQILEALYLMNQSKKGSESLRKMQECRKFYHLGMQLTERAKREEAKKLFVKAYKIAKEYGFTFLTCGCVVELMATAARNGKLKAYEHYAAEKDALLLDLQAEFLAKEYYYKIMIHMNKKRGATGNIFSELISKLDTLPCSSTKFLEYYYTIRTMQHTHIIDYPAIRQESKNALEILEKRKGVPDSVLQFFTRNKGLSHTALKEFTEARKLLSKAKQYAPLHSHNLGILHYYEAINELHSGNYKRAYELYRAHRKTKYETLRDQWAVLSGYLFFLSKTQHLDVGTDRFSVGKYLNETINVTHDKTGNKINIIIGELLMLLFKDRDRFIDRAAIHANYKYLNGYEVRRAKWFIKILCTLPRANFNWVALRRLARRSFDNLKSTAIKMGNNLSIEIIPFEALLEMIRVLLTAKSQGEELLEKSSLGAW